MFKFFTSFGASTNFQKYRLQVTAKTTEAPEENVLKKLIKTFHGEDEETRSQIAFATIIKKIQTSDYNDSWMYLLKNLIILDRVLGDMYFVEEIAVLELSVINMYVQRVSKYMELRTDEIIKNYWKLIKYTAKLFGLKKHILCYPRSQRKEFLQTLTPKQILSQIQTLQNLFKHCFSIVGIFNSTKNLREPIQHALKDLQKTQLIEYLYLQIIYKFYRYYSSQLLCVNQLFFYVSKDKSLDVLSLEELKSFKACLQRYKQNATSFINFAEKNKNIKGFEVVNYRELDPMRDFDLIKAIDSYISEKVSADEMTSSVKSYISGSKMEISVKIKAKLSQNNDIEKRNHRIQIDCKREGDSDRNNAFSNWIPNYSEDFPQRQIMTLDLIMLLKEEQKNESRYVEQKGEDEIYLDRQTIEVDDEDSYGLVFKKPRQVCLKGEFKNIYSDLESTWSN